MSGQSTTDSVKDKLEIIVRGLLFFDSLINHEVIFMKRMIRFGKKQLEIFICKRNAHLDKILLRSISSRVRF